MINFNEEVKALDIHDKIEKTVNWIRDTVNGAGLNGVVVGLSGGIDSAVAASLMKRAFPDTSMGIIIPINSIAKDQEHAILLAEEIGITHFSFDLTKQHGEMISQITRALDYNGEHKRIADANLRARLRMSCIYTIANLYNYMVVGTDNAAELLTGYFTKYGDGACDILPLANLLKSEVYDWARVLGVPDVIINKAPSAGLWEGQTDEKEMGTTYEMIDRYIKNEKLPEKDKLLIKKLYERSEHKRSLPLQCPNF